MKTRRDILPQIEGAVFRVITDTDWQRELRAARARRNAISARIQKILATEKLVSAQQNQIEKEHKK